MFNNISKNFLCITFALILLISGVYVDDVSIDSYLRYNNLTASPNNLISGDYACDIDMCTCEMISQSSRAVFTGDTCSRFAGSHSKEIFFLSGEVLKPLQFSFYGFAYVIYINDLTPSATAILEYIHNQDGKK